MQVCAACNVGLTALHAAAECGHLEVEKSSTCGFFYAVEAALRQVVQGLLQASADHTQASQDKGGSTKVGGIALVLTTLFFSSRLIWDEMGCDML